MWNYYIKNGNYSGVSIGFSANIRYEYIKPLNVDKEEYSFEILDVIYNKEEQENKFKDIILELKPYWQSRENHKKIEEIISHALTSWQLFFKSDKFEHEKETRMIFYIPKNRDNLTEGANKKLALKYREKNGMYISYMDVDFFKPAITQITIAPSYKEDVVCNSIKEYLDNNGYSNIEIKRSEIPIRY